MRKTSRDGKTINERITNNENGRKKQTDRELLRQKYLDELQNVLNNE